jgi:hypothetical protein
MGKRGFRPSRRGSDVRFHPQVSIPEHVWANLESHSLAKLLLQASVVALAFGMNLKQVLHAGRSGFLYTAISILRRNAEVKVVRDGPKHPLTEVLHGLLLLQGARV